MSAAGSFKDAPVDLNTVRSLAASMSDEDGVFSTDIKTLTRCRDSLLALAAEVERLRKRAEGC